MTELFVNVLFVNVLFANKPSVDERFVKARCALCAA
jgi:hypothetical protein